MSVRLVRSALVDPEIFQAFKLISKHNLTHDTKIFRFELPKNTVLGFTPGTHVAVRAEIDGVTVKRVYSPTSDIDQQEWFDLLIKVYQESPMYPGGGKMSRYIDSLKIGDYLDIRGPGGFNKYLGKGAFSIAYVKGDPEELRHFKNIGMIAGGTGMAPLYQIAKTISDESGTPTNTKMIFSNHTENDIIMRAEFDELERKNPEKFKIWYTLTKSAPPNWKYGQGRVTLEMLKNHLPPPGDDTLILVCGPKEFVKVHCASLLSQLGYSAKSIYKY